MTYFSFIPRLVTLGHQNAKDIGRLQPVEKYPLSEITTELKNSGDLPNDCATERAARSRQGYSSYDYT